MSMLICPSCQEQLIVPEEALGQQVQCPSCQTITDTQIPYVAQTAASVEPFETARTVPSLRRPSEKVKAVPPRIRPKLTPPQVDYRPVSPTAMGATLAVTAGIILLSLWAGVSTSFRMPLLPVFVPVVAIWAAFLFMAGIYRWRWLEKPLTPLFAILLLTSRYNATGCMLCGLFLGIIATALAVLPWVMPTGKEQSANGNRAADQEAVIPPPVAPAIAINCGGGAVGHFVADAGSSGGFVFSSDEKVDTAGVVNAAPQEVYRTERYGTFRYAVGQLDAGVSYQVRLHFAEIAVDRRGERFFHVEINGRRVLTDFDILAEAGRKHRALVREFTVKADPRGRIELRFIRSVNQPKLSGFEIIRVN